MGGGGVTLLFLIENGGHIIATAEVFWRAKQNFIDYVDFEVEVEC